MTKLYYRPIVLTGKSRPGTAVQVAGGWGWFTQAEVLSRKGRGDFIGVDEMPDAVLKAISTPRKPISGLDFSQPALMGILNVTPDSFSDGGEFDTLENARNQAVQMIDEGAEIIDIGGESTRPGAKFVDIDTEIQRVVPAISALAAQFRGAISVDTRKSEVAKAAIAAGATIVNDVSGLTFDPELANVVAKTGVGLCLMHTQGTPETMQDNPTYSSILLDVYDFLERQILAAETAGIPREKIIIDPGIGFGKTVSHCLELISGLSLFHGLGCAILLGTSRKSFIGHILQRSLAKDRAFGTVATSITGLSQGVQLFRVHDVSAHADAFLVSRAILKK